MATIGTSLFAPEVGWRRFDNNNVKIKYTGSWSTATTSYPYLGNFHYSTYAGSTIKFTFNATKLRIIAFTELNYNANTTIEIDGVSETFSYNTPTSVSNNLVYEKVFTEAIDRTVVIKRTSGTATDRITLDAVDMDSKGYLIADIFDAIPVPEEEWQRIDSHNNENIIYEGTWQDSSSSSSYYNNYRKESPKTTLNSVVKFKFKGTKLRLLSTIYTTYSNQIEVKLDGVAEIVSQSSPTTKNIAIFYQKYGLSDTIHTVEIRKLANSTYVVDMTFDAIDINLNGYLVPQTRNIGDTVLNPDAGWKRSDTDVASFIGDGWVKSVVNATNYHNSQMKFRIGQIKEGKITFNFTGNSLRLIGYKTIDNTLYDTNAKVKIDGVESGTINYVGSAEKYKALLYENTSLTNGMHIVEISGLNMNLDAIDILQSERAYHLEEVASYNDLTIGKRIRCNYSIHEQYVRGIFSNLGKETSDFIPPSSISVLMGDFYYIMVDDKMGNKKLVADRNVQNFINWSVLNDGGYAIVGGIKTPEKQVASIVPKMVNNTSHNCLVTSSTTHTSYQPYSAFDKTFNNAYGWLTESGQKTGWICFEFPYARKIVRYSVSSGTATNYFDTLPKDWSFEGFDNENGWVVLDVQKGVVFDVSSTKYFDITNQNSYKKYRLNIQENNGHASYLSVQELDMFSEFEIHSILEEYEFRTGMLTGGINEFFIDNEWNKYLVNSTLNNKIKAGDDGVWNWTGILSWTSTTTSGTGRALRGSTSVSNFQIYTSTYQQGIAGFRPVLTMKSKFIPITKTFVEYQNEYKKWIEDIPEVKKNIVPTLTSNSRPIPFIVTASSEFDANRQAWKAFNGTSLGVDDIWMSTQSTGYLEVKVDVPRIVTKYDIVAYENGTLSVTNSPRHWTIEGSNDGLNWTVLDTRAYQTNWKTFERRSYKFTNTEEYLYYKINITANNGHPNLAISLLCLYEIETPAIIREWKTVSTTLPSLDTFMSEGMDDPFILDRREKVYNFQMDDYSETGQVLGVGKVFREKVDLSKLLSIKSMTLK